MTSFTRDKCTPKFIESTMYGLEDIAHTREIEDDTHGARRASAVRRRPHNECLVNALEAIVRLVVVINREPVVRLVSDKF